MPAQPATKWTPGPWRFSEMRRPPVGNYQTNEEKDANGNIFYGYSITGSNEHGSMIYPTLGCVHNFPENICANAHLISAAPELYEALEEFADLLKVINDKDQTKEEWGPRIEVAYQNARTALAKARGEQS